MPPDARVGGRIGSVYKGQSAPGIGPHVGHLEYCGEIQITGQVPGLPPALHTSVVMAAIWYRHSLLRLPIVFDTRLARQVRRGRSWWTALLPIANIEADTMAYFLSWPRHEASPHAPSCQRSQSACRSASQSSLLHRHEAAEQCHAEGQPGRTCNGTSDSKTTAEPLEISGQCAAAKVFMTRFLSQILASLARAT